MSSTFRAGAAQVNITPPVGVPQAGYGARERGSEAVDDELFGKALVLDDGERELAVVTSDLISLAPEFVARLRDLVQAQTGIPPQNVLACASHTHFGPALKRLEYLPGEALTGFADSYVDNLIRLLASAVRQARDARQPARVGGGVGQAPELVFNRRTKKADGKVRMSFRLPPPEEAAQLTFAPIDPDVGVLKVESTDGQLIAALINFACHPVCGVDRLYAISADYPGYAMKVVEQVEGGVCLFALGCAGNIVPIEREGRARRWIGTALGAEALKVLQRVRTTERAPLHVANSTVELPLRPLPSVEEAQREVEEAQRRLAKWRAQSRSAEDIINPKGDLLRAEHLLRLAKEAGGKPTATTEVQAIRIGEITLVGLPGEVFVEIGLAVKAGVHPSPLTPHPSPVFVLSLCNDGLAYVPIADAYDEGGYEPEWTKLGRGAGEQLVESALSLIAE